MVRCGIVPDEGMPYGGQNDFDCSRNEISQTYVYLRSCCRRLINVIYVCGFYLVFFHIMENFLESMINSIRKRLVYCMPSKKILADFCQNKSCLEYFDVFTNNEWKQE